MYLGWLFQRSSVCIQRKRLQLSLLWGNNAVEGQLLTSWKVICLHLLWACGNVKNFDWIDFNLVMFSCYLLPMTTISMLISLSIRIVSSEWIDQRELCGILMLANMIYMVFGCTCIGINVQKGRNRGKASFSLACVMCDLFFIHFPCCLTPVGFHLHKGCEVTFQYDKSFFSTSDINA